MIRLAVVSLLSSLVLRPRAESLATPLVRAYDDVLPLDLLDGVYSEAATANEWEYDTEYDKQPTHWFDIKGPTQGQEGMFSALLSAVRGNAQGQARFHIEAAITMLRKFAVPEEFYGDGEYRAEELVGAEWWVHKVDPTDDISFHYDKDEGQHSTEEKAYFPALSTITYLDDVGAPTLVLNQTLNAQQNVPVVPSDAYLFYPKRNRHVVFRSSLHHGCPGRLSRASDTFTVTLDRSSGGKVGLRNDEYGPVATSEPGTLLADWNRAHPDNPVREGDQLVELNGIAIQSSPKSRWSKELRSRHALNMTFRKTRSRMTLLINWWTYKPAEPAIRLPSALARRFGLTSVAKVPSTKEIAAWRAGDHTDIAQAESLRTDVDASSAKSSMTRHLSQFRPSAGFWYYLPNYVSDGSAKSSIFRITWGEGSAFGGIGLLNPDDERQAQALRRTERPNLYVFHHPKQHRQLLETFLPTSQGLLGRCSPYLATPREARQLMADVFKIQDQDLPALVLEDVRTHRKLVRRLWDFRSESMLGFVDQFFNGEYHQEEL